MADLGISNSELDEVSKSLIINPKAEKAKASEEESASDEEEADDEEAPTDELQDDFSEEEASDGQSDEEESDEEESDSEQDIDEVEIDVVVDGETKSVKLKDLKAKYSGEMAIESRLQEVTETKAKVLNVGNALYKTLVEQSERLKKLDQFLQEQAKPAINWEELRVKDPGKYLLERDKAREAEDRRKQLEEEQNRINAQKAELENMQMQEYAATQARELTRKMPEISDPVKSKQVMQDISEASRHYGLSEEELSAIVDHRHLMILIDAARYRKLMDEKTGKKPSKKIELIKPRPLVKSGTNKPNKMTSSKKEELAVVKKAKSTGHVDDIAKLLMVRRKNG